jgi:predicted unusual protein kinase regulating ubiquinone biosynthesis (AarF/ABC1/UbiB family)
MTRYYFDEHMRRVVANALIQAGFPTIMAVDVGMVGKSDDDHLAYATQAQMIMVTFDRPFAGVTMRRSNFYALLCVSEEFRQDIGGTIELLKEFGALFDSEQDTGKVHWMP